MQTPIVSIIMCTYNRANYLREAIESVLAQTYSDWELLILDDCSTDNTKDIVSEYQAKDPRIVYIKNDKNLGINKNRNKALELSTGKYIAVLDSDDIWSDTYKLQQQFEFLDANPDYCLIGSNVEIIDENSKAIGEIKYETEDTKIREKVLLRNQIAHSSVLYRKDTAHKAGLYDANIRIWEDYDLWLKMGRLGKFRNLSSFTTKYRIHKSNSFSNIKSKGAFTHLQIIRRYKKDYPNYYRALAKAYLRILKSFFF
jgi:glycosyltransferase involved in cell wall biosynthesis